MSLNDDQRGAGLGVGIPACMGGRAVLEYGAVRPCSWNGDGSKFALALSLPPPVHTSRLPPRSFPASSSDELSDEISWL